MLAAPGKRQRDDKLAAPANRLRAQAAVAATAASTAAVAATPY